MKKIIMIKLLILLLVLSAYLGIVTAASITSDGKHKQIKIAVMELLGGSGVSRGDASIITDRLRIELFNTGNVTIMERNQMNAILKEQGLQQSGVCSDDGCMVEIGQMLGVDRLVGGSIGKLGSMYLLNFRVIDVETGEIVSVVSLDIKGSIEEVVYKLNEIAWKLIALKSGETATIISKTNTIELNATVKSKNSGVKQKAYTIDSDIECGDEYVFLRTMDYAKELNFIVEDATRAEVDKDLRESLEGVLTDNVDKDLKVVVVTEEQIAKLPADCMSKVVRPVVKSYAVADNKGVATVVFYFFAEPRTHSYYFKAKVTDSGIGDNDSTPQSIIMDTFEELEDKLEDVLDDSDYREQLSRMDPKYYRSKE